MKNNYSNFIALFGLLLLMYTGIAFGASVNSQVVNGQKQAQLQQEANDFFRQAGEAQNVEQSRNLYRKALLRFEGLAANGVSNGKLFYNIGNTYFRLGDLGRALVNYRRAEHFLPNDENLRQNITYLLGRQTDNIELQQDEQIVKTLFFWHYDFSYKTRLICLSVFNVILWGLLIVRLFWFPGKMGWAISLSVLVCLLLGGSLLLESNGGGRRMGVVVASEVIARRGDGLSYKPSFEGSLHAGLDFSLVEERGSWLHISLRDGSKCWIPSDSAEMVF